MGDLCYPKCKDGFQGVGEDCWQKCPEGYRSNGAECQKPKALGRGWGSHKPCKDCDKWGLLWYPKCPAGYTQEGCCFCVPDCPEGMGEAGLQCAKEKFTRINPHPMVCPDGKEQQGFMCYDQCPDGEDGSQNLCWGKCPVGTEQCGVLCLGPGDTCTAYIASIGKDTLTSMFAQKQMLKGGQQMNDLDLNNIEEEVYNNQIKSMFKPEEVVTVGGGLSYPVCKSFH